MIARPDQLKGLIVYKHPDQNIPMYSQLTVDSDECAVFFKDGKVVGVLPPGRHTMSTQNIPFLNNLINKFTGGDVFISQERVGRFQKPIHIYKFRSMTGNDQGNYGENGKTELTVTRVGRRPRAMTIRKRGRRKWQGLWLPGRQSPRGPGHRP